MTYTHDYAINKDIEAFISSKSRISGMVGDLFQSIPEIGKQPG